jgi:hypothetical protein
MLAYDDISQGIDKTVFACQQVRKRRDVLPVDGPHELVRNPFRHVFHADIVDDGGS